MTTVVYKQNIPKEICFPRKQYLSLQRCLREWEYLRGKDIQNSIPLQFRQQAENRVSCS